MNNSNQSKQVLLSVIGVAILVVAVVGVSFAFFSYVNNGTNNTIETGTIKFVSTQSETLTVTNAFPVTSANADDAVTITVSGQTSYSGGIAYDVRAVDFHNLETAKVVKEGDTDVYVKPSMTVACSNKTANITCDAATVDLTWWSDYDGPVLLASGTIDTTAAGSSDDSATITINAFYDAAKYWISDNGTLSEVKALNESAGLAAPTNQSIVTTEAWNNLQKHPISFTIQVRATEGATLNTKTTG